MGELLLTWYNNSTAPLWSAILLGLITAVSPCPLATNITAIGYIGKNIEDRKRVFKSGLVYTLGGMLAYTSLAIVFLIGGEKIHLSKYFQLYGEKIIGPFLIITGILLLGLFKLKFPSFQRFSNHFQQKVKHNYFDVLLLGMVFALAFCPYTGVIYFGLLIPLTLSSKGGIVLPVVYSLSSAVPVVVFSWLISFSVGSLSSVYNKTKVFGKWFRIIGALLFIIAGVYLIIQLF
jgi:cytochrome c-type biogenesis protein